MIATIGERSIIPMRGMIDRKGAKTGSVICTMKTTNGLRGSRLGIQERSARAKIAIVRIQTRSWTKVAMTTMVLPPSQRLRFRVGRNHCLDEGGPHASFL